MIILYDAIIVGGGPAGLTAAIYLLRACKKVLVIEKEAFGGQILKSSNVMNYPGFSSIKGLELGNLFYEQAKGMGMESLYGEVTSITKEKDFFLVNVSSQEYKSKTLIYAAGLHPRKLSFASFDRFIGSGVSFCATCDGAFFKDKTVCVVGGGNTAVDDALYLSNICEKVYLIHRREEFRAEPIHIQKLKEKKNVIVLQNTVVTDILGEQKIEKVVLQKEDEKEEIFVDGVFVAIGSIPNTSILKDFVPLNSNGYILTNLFLQTSVPGFFAVGDVREKKVRQLTTAVSDGTIAAIEVQNYLDET